MTATVNFGSGPRRSANALLMATVLAFGAVDKEAGSNLDGKWTIVYAEEGGRRNTAWENRPAMFKDSTLSYEEEGKTRSVKLKFGPHQTVSATGLSKDEDKACKGVYVAGRDYLTISLITSDKEREGGSSGDFILILRRQRK